MLSVPHPSAGCLSLSLALSLSGRSTNTVRVANVRVHFHFQSTVRSEWFLWGATYLFIMRILRRLKYTHHLADPGVKFYLGLIRFLSILGIANVSFKRGNSNEKNENKNKKSKKFQSGENVPSEKERTKDIGFRTSKL